MLVEVFNILFALISAFAVCCIVNSKAKSNIKITLLIVLVTGVINLIADFFILERITIIFPIAGIILVCRFVAKEHLKTSIFIALLITFLHRVLLILFMSALYVFARDYFSNVNKGYFSLMYSMLFINVVAVVIIWLYNKYKSIDNISEKSIKTINELSLFVLPPKLFGGLYALVSIVDTIVCIIIPISALKT